MPVDDGECVELSLGLLTPGDVYEITVLVIDDALDVLVLMMQVCNLTFLVNRIDPPTNKSLRLSSPTVHTNSIGRFHSPSLKSHGRLSSITLPMMAIKGTVTKAVIWDVSISITKLNDGQWVSFHDLVGIIPDGHLTLLEGDDLRLEEGTTVSVTAWSLEGFGDVYLQTES